MSSSGTAITNRSFGPFSSFQYRSTDSVLLETTENDSARAAAEPEISITEKALSERLAAARAEGFADAEAKLRQAYEHRSEQQTKIIFDAIANFDVEQKSYFARVESEVVQLALAIAGKILHREAQVDPMLVAAIVHLALGQLKEGSVATVRIRPEDAGRWREHFATQVTNLSVKVVEDTELERGDCVLETELGTVNFSLDAQLKEVERGFFDVLAQKPKM